LASLCVSFDAVEDEEGLRQTLAGAAALADASKLAIWLEDSLSGTFQPVTAHGYSPQALARMPAVPRDADNAVALAGVTRSLQIVPAPAPGARSALVAPLVSAGTAFGVITVELPEGRESSPTTQAVVTLLATQLAHVFAPPPASVEADRHAQTA
jgi:GAF domain-containing protein